MLVKELVYLILDSIKAISDDSIFNEEHVLFLCKKYRSFLIKKEQEKEKATADVASEFEYQQICLDLEKVAAIDGMPCTGGYYLRTSTKVPKILEGNQPRVYPVDFYQSINVCFVSRDRMRFVGTNKYLQNIIWASLGPDLHVYLKSNNPQFMYLKKLRLSAVFEDFDEVMGLQCDDEGNTDGVACDALDGTFPIREYLVPMLIELVVKEVTQSMYRFVDKQNNATDDTYKIAAAAAASRR